MSNVIPFKKKFEGEEEEEVVLVSLQGTVKLTGFYAYEERNPKALEMFARGLQVAERRGFTQRKALIKYFSEPTATQAGRDAFAAFLEKVPAEEFLSISGFNLVSA